MMNNAKGNLQAKYALAIFFALQMAIGEGFLHSPSLVHPALQYPAAKILAQRVMRNSSGSETFSDINGSKISAKKKTKKNTKVVTTGLCFTAAVAILILGGPFAFTAVPYLACLLWGLPSSKVGSWKSIVSMGHRLGGIVTLLLPLILTWYHAVTGLFPPMPLYFGTVATAIANLSFGGSLICCRVPAYDIPTLRAFAVGVSLGFAFLGQSLLFVLGKFAWYQPFGVLFAVTSVYAAVFAWSDALQHAWNFLPSSKQNDLPATNAGTKSLHRFWTLPFEKPKVGDVFLRNIWRQPTPEALKTTVSPANGVVVFTTGMTALFASLSLLQLRYLLLGPAGMMQLCIAEPDFCHWSALQALLAIVANNFGTFAGTLVIQRQTSQKKAGFYNAIGLLVPVLNIVTFLVLNRGCTTISDFVRLITLPAAH
mmetsp:Transcript_61530/g.91484  ORF Transcript_61530/g.91484 Transcript_61530/m.91484 type:complete len:425 (+) Transcript_61530:33-1307(+)